MLKSHSLWKYSLIVFSFFRNFLIEFKGSLHIVDINSLSDIHIFYFLSIILEEMFLFSSNTYWLFSSSLWMVYSFSWYAYAWTDFKFNKVQNTSLCPKKSFAYTYNLKIFSFVLLKNVTIRFKLVLKMGVKI